MRDNRSSFLLLIFGYPFPKSGEKLTALTAGNCWLGATNEQSI